MLIVSPIIYLQVSACGYRGKITLEDQLVVHEKLGETHTIIIIGSLAVVVGPNAKAHFSPSGKTRGEMMGRETKHLLAGGAVENTFPLHWCGHEAMSLRRRGIFHQPWNILQGIVLGPSTIVQQLQMQVWSLRGACIPTLGDDITLGNRHLVGFETKTSRRLPGQVLVTTQYRFNAWRERLQVTIHASVALRMAHIDRIAKAVHSNGDLGNITITDGKHGLSLYLARFYVNTTMEMVGSRLSEVTRQGNLVVYGTGESHLRCQCQRGEKRAQHALKLISSPFTLWVKAPTDTKSTPCSA